MQNLRPLAIATIALLLAPPSSAFPAQSQRAMVATVHPIATEAGLQALRAGGNAVDAAVAAALTLGVVDGHNSGIGGGCFILIRSPNGDVTAIDGRETAPAAAHRDMFLRQGQAIPELSQQGALAIGVPGALQAYQAALNRLGQLQLPQLLLPAADIAQRGFPIDRVYAAKLQSSQAALATDPGCRNVLLRCDGSPRVEGEILRQPDLARTYRQIALHGTDWFYRGEFADRVADWMAQHGGLLTRSDFAAYQPKFRQPIQTTYREFEVIGFPPPSSGGVHVAQMLNMLERFDAPQLYRQDPATYYHVVAEAMKLAFADRAYWLGDADFAQVPKGLIDKPYANHLAQRISPRQASHVAQHSMPDQWDSRLFHRHTTHIAAADEQGYWVGITATINTSFGSKVIVPQTGVLLNNEMDDFSAQPGAPNTFGLVGAKNNSIQPHKRPLSSMSPTIVLRQGQPVLTVGAAGGPKIITQVLLTIMNHLELQMPLETAVASSRLHHQWFPDSLMVESTFPVNLVNDLKMKGHNITVLTSGGVTQAIARQGDHFIGVSDPRAAGQAAGL